MMNLQETVAFATFENTIPCITNDKEQKVALYHCKSWTDPSFWQNTAVADVLRSLVAGGDIMKRNKTGKTPLHMAAELSDVETVRALLDAGACVRSLDDQGRNPLYYAVNRGDAEIVRTLLDAGADVNNQSGQRSIAALHIAAKTGDDEIVQALLDAGADTELRQKGKGMTPLHFAAAWGNVESVRALLDAGADAGAKDAFGMIPLMYAPESARALLETGSGGRPLVAGAAGENRNIMLYWEGYPSPEVSAVVEKWRNVCPNWNVALFDEGTACRFLLERFGGEIVRLFLRCAIPAMKADFFRVFWAMSAGGIYSDVSFVPRREPLFFDPEKDITVVTHRSPRTILNGIFFSKQGAKELKLVAHEIIRSISHKRIPYVAIATGPGAWGRALGRRETSTMAVIEYDYLERFVNVSGYSKELRSSEMHWTNIQKRMSIYR